jgi:hypothetical protein
MKIVSSVHAAAARDKGGAAGLLGIYSPNLFPAACIYAEAQAPQQQERKQAGPSFLSICTYNLHRGANKFLSSPTHFEIPRFC